VWEQVLHLARQHPSGTVCHFKGGAFLKAIGRSAGKDNYKWLATVLTRLTACEVRFKRPGYIYGRGLIASYDIDKHTGLYRISVDPDTAKVYAAGWTSVDWQQRQELRAKPLALWLHGYYATHAKPLPVKVETLRNLAGSKAKTLYHFRAALRQALDELKVIGAIASWKIITADLVTVDRGDAITASQRRHLIRARPRKKHKN
jgi:TrfA protein